MKPQAASVAQASARDLRLLSAMNDVSGIPTTGKNLIILAVVQDVLHFRIFDGHGAMVVDTDEGKRRAELTGEIEDLKLLLEKLWPPHGLTNIEKDQVVTAITSIVGHTFKDDLQPVESPSGTFIVQTPPACLLFCVSGGATSRPARTTSMNSSSGRPTTFAAPS